VTLNTPLEAQVAPFFFPPIARKCDLSLKVSFLPLRGARKRAGVSLFWSADLADDRLLLLNQTSYGRGSQ